LRERRDELTRYDVRVFAVTFESRGRVDAYLARESPGFPILRDPRRAAYRAFGLGRRGTLGIWSPRTLWYYARQALRGRLPRVARADMHQLGGDVLLAPDGGVCWLYRSRQPADRPSIDDILTALDACTRG
jgi:hypothetical protein